MAGPPRARINKELEDIERDESCGLRIRRDSDFTMTGFFPGPDDTPYVGGTFTVSIEIPNGYPFEPPKMKFKNKVWHPNVSSVTGAICLDILKDQWSPALTLKTAMISLQALLCAPVPEDPQDGVVANQYLNSFEEYEEQAREWTSTYASPEAAEEAAEDPNVTALMGLGVPTKEEAAKLLGEVNGNVEAAADLFFSRGV
uniref:E2 ubiquitin-conjugating enzyme n=1 Tax=Phaeomonas parva TaxID=124430 RepID=A0A6U4D5Z1_9STRA|mmetsp:Transcript_15632/g.47617  ORF Transcript_15632/g.47617 Transcript_15632/m.47617 type:complete len:200 (+) Transcript_15632:171-770(+)|eukprot:CAMPEP_0118883792 /NCGR_PEP_ID=MMETSP1163-20130328/22793_1 /TAXON_ID=124430 /ORGANISM="Phaeomonas parva, Strain CCMP2877" /LENGTH=199 /DNA_ID=CAMNT_0006821339 /DNA_START=390 /DNA_END=989 /DNA_ORIENTATION=-